MSDDDKTYWADPVEARTHNLLLLEAHEQGQLSDGLWLGPVLLVIAVGAGVAIGYAIWG